MVESEPIYTHGPQLYKRKKLGQRYTCNIENRTSHGLYTRTCNIENRKKTSKEKCDGKKIMEII